MKADKLIQVENRDTKKADIPMTAVLEEKYQNNVEELKLKL